MYSKEELSNIKYNDLLKILKKLGIKGGRQKTERVIELILENQNAAHDNSSKSTLETSLSDSKLMDDEIGTRMTNNSSFVDNNSENDMDIQLSQNTVSKLKKNSMTKKRVTRSSTLNLKELIDEVDQKVKDDHQKAKSPDHQKKLTNDDNHKKLTKDDHQKKLTNDDNHKKLTKDDHQKKLTNDDNHKKLTKDDHQKKLTNDDNHNSSPSLSRSNTFVLDDGLPDDSLTASFNLNLSLNRSKTFTLEEDKRKSISASPEKKMDLCCAEVQTAEDIEKIEHGREEPSFIGSPSIIGSRTKKGIRRSLRGQLLESKMYLKEVFPKMPTISSEEAESVAPDGHSVGEEHQAVTTFNQDNFIVPKTFDFEKKFNSGEKSSGIPRFVSFARKLKMPDFNRIHENAFKKMEALDDYVERRRARTKSVIETAAEDKKELGGHKEGKKFEVSKLIHSASSRRIGSQTPSSVSKRRSSTLGIQNSSSPAGSVRAKDSTQRSASSLRPCTIPKLVKENFPPKSNPSNLWNKPQTDPGSPGSFQRRKSYIPTPPRPSFAFGKLTGDPQGTLKRNGEHKTCNRIQAMKKAVNKKPNVKSSAEIRASEKVFIKGVRTNRRFELQMANRGIGPV